MKILKGVIVMVLFFAVTQVSAQQQDMEKVKKKFAKMDSDKNDFLDKAEFEAFYKDKKNKKEEPIQWESMFLGTDANDDGKVTLEELVAPIDWKKAKEKAKSAGKE